MLFLSSFFSCCQRLVSYFSILIISFCRKVMNLTCSSCFFFYSGFIGFCFSSSAACSFCYSSHSFSDSILLLNLFQNLQRLNSSMSSGTIGSIGINFLSNLLLMCALSTYFQLNFIISTPYLADRLSQRVMLWRFIVSSKITYFIQPFALQSTCPSQSE